MICRRVACALALGLVTVAPSASAHSPSEAYLSIEIDEDQIGARLDVPVRDLDVPLALDSDGDGAITWGELVSRERQLASYIRDRLLFSIGAEPCTSSIGVMGLVQLSTGPHWSTSISVGCPRSIDRVTLRYRLLVETDAMHRGVVRVHGAETRTHIAHHDEPIEIAAGTKTSLGEFMHEGVWHIWHGTDHVLFLVCLILPAVYAPGGRVRASVAPAWSALSWREVVADVFSVVTAFTIAHSLTLVISAAGFVTLPSRYVETAIALSVVAAAVNNLVRLVDARWTVAFALGLLHGFGFSSVLLDLGLSSQELMRPLLGFNLGVELGQLVIVLAVLPVLFLIRTTIIYRVLLWGGSAAIAVIAAVWSFQRFSS